MAVNKNILCINIDLESVNLGCAALGLSFIDIIQDIAEHENVHFVIDIIGYGKGKGKHYSNKYIEVNDPFCFDVLNYKFWKKVNLLVSHADLIIDFTGGDSFTDIYGIRRFVRESIVKKYAIAKGNCFVLGPQTVGPFKHRFSKYIAKYLMNHTDYIFARDKISYEYVTEMGCNCTLTTDIAFSLKPTCNKFNYLIRNQKTKIGVNISGLMMSGGYTNNQFNLKLNYKIFSEILIAECLKRGFDVYLIPHVLPLKSPVEDDYRASEELKMKFPEIILAPRFSSPKEAKEYIGHMDFFVGSRMHATIASFSMCVPTIPVAYSPKFSRLFSSIGYDRVIDGKDTSESEAVDIIINCILNREEIKTEMAKSLELIKIRNYDFKNRIRNILIK